MIKVAITLTTNGPWITATAKALYQTKGQPETMACAYQCSSDRIGIRKARKLVVDGVTKDFKSMWATQVKAGLVKKDALQFKRVP